MATSYVPLQQDMLEAVGGKTATFNTSQTPSFFASTSFIYTLALVIIVAAASFRYAYAGILRIDASESGIKKSKEEFTRVTYGLLGVLGLWLILFTVNKDMLTGDVTLSNLKAEVGAPAASTGNTGTTPTIPGTTTNPPTTGGGSESDNRATLSAAGITINKPACVGASTDCTNIANINPKSIDLLLNLKRSCNCSVLVTAGTEGGHSTNSNHGPGKEAIDISLTQELVTFLKQQGVNVGNDTTCNTKYGWGGFVFWDEAQGCDSVGGVRHFHVSFTGR